GDAGKKLVVLNYAKLRDAKLGACVADGQIHQLSSDFDTVTHSLRPHNWNTLGRLISVRGSSVNRVNPSIADCNSGSVTNFSSSKESAMLMSVSTAICLPSPEANVGCTTLISTFRHPASSNIP